MRTEAELDSLMESCFKDIQGAHIYDEYRRLLSLLNRLPPVRSMIEIGSEAGGSIRVWTKLWDPLSIFNIDFNTYGHAQGKQVDYEKQWHSWLTPNQTIDTVWGDSHSQESKDKLIANIKSRGFGTGTVDLLYVDGDHSEAGTEQDYLMYRDLVTPGGLILFHDIHPYPGREQDSPNRPAVGAYRFWERLRGPAVDMFDNREYHKGLRPNFIEVCHDCQKQSAFGYGLLFV
jgi:predicted O-methyltransferase YrrM